MFPAVTRFRSIALVVIIGAGTVALAEDGKHRPILPPPATTVLSASAVPPSGDQNPYGLVFVPEGFPSGGPLEPGDLITSNFNDITNTQGTGSSIVQIKQDGSTAVFYQGPDGLGFTTALGALKDGFVIVGMVPTTDGTCATISAGGLLILDRFGNVVTTLTDTALLDGPWDLVVHDTEDGALVFVSNVLSGAVTRIDFMVDDGGSISVESETQIASGYATACNAAAVVVGPTGLAYDSRRDLLYVASTDDNAIFAVRRARRTREDHGKGRLVYQDDAHLHGPLALVLAPNDHLLTANGDAVNPDPAHNSEIVEFTRDGDFVAQFQVDPVVGSAFGIAVTAMDGGIFFAAVDDNLSIVEEWFEQR